MYNNSFWELKKKIQEAARKSDRSYRPGPEWRDEHGEVQRGEYLERREEERFNAKGKAISSLRRAQKEVPDHGIPENLDDLIRDASTVKHSKVIDKHAQKIMSSKHPAMQRLGDHLRDLSYLYSSNPPHPKRPEPDVYPD